MFLVCISLMISDIGPLSIFLREISIQALIPFLNELLVSVFVLLLSFRSSLRILDHNLYHICGLKIFSSIP